MAHNWIELAWIAAGSALGGTARFALSGLIARRMGEAFPWGTLAVNVSGAFLIGVIAAPAVGGVFSGLPSFWEFAVIGVLGSYTTVSSFSLQTLALARDGRYASAGANALGSLALCLAAVTLGFAAGVGWHGWNSA